jgi:hypothetical protein
MTNLYSSFPALVTSALGFVMQPFLPEWVYYQAGWDLA